MGAGGENIAPVPIEDNIKKVPIPMSAWRLPRNPNRTRWPTIRPPARRRRRLAQRAAPPAAPQRAPRCASAGGSVQRHVSAAAVAVPQSHSRRPARWPPGYACDGEAV